MIVPLTRPSIARAAILPVAGMLSVITLLAVVGLASRYSAGATAKLLEKAALTARVIAPNAAAAAWNFDAQSGTRLLQSLESDPRWLASRHCSRCVHCLHGFSRGLRSRSERSPAP